jgi:hypothetical protein
MFSRFSLDLSALLGCCPCRPYPYIRREVEVESSSVGRINLLLVLASWRLPELSDSKIWPWIPWDSEPRITVLARASSSSAVSQSVSQSVSIVSLGFGSCRNRWPYFCFFPRLLHVLKWSSSSTRGGVWLLLLLLLLVSLTDRLKPNHLTSSFEASVNLYWTTRSHIIQDCSDPIIINIDNQETLQNANLRSLPSFIRETSRALL